MLGHNPNEPPRTPPGNDPPTPNEDGFPFGPGETLSFTYGTSSWDYGPSGSGSLENTSSFTYGTD